LRYFISFHCVLLIVGSTLSQGLFKRNYEPKRLVLLDLTLKRQYPGGDLVSRYGPNTSIGLELLYKTTTNWLFGAGGHFMFGNFVKETGVLDALKGSTGEIIDQNGQFAVVGMDQRGMYLGASVGKTIPINRNNRNSGIYISLGGGFLSHRIRIYSSNTVPQLSDIYLKGYDRYTFGPATTEFIGYRFLDPRKRINFSVGLEMMQGYTKNRRSLNFDTRVYDNKSRLDLLTSLKFTLTIPIDLKSSDEEQFFE